ncbi:hypothetical protein FRC17_000228 [Serendipita sp. 399]|nr:hypothetical protein FRC17_000228 [Serendipita sp. 399]
MTYLSRLKPLFSSSKLFSDTNNAPRGPFNKRDEEFLVDMSYDWKDRRSNAKNHGLKLMDWTNVNDMFVKMGTGGTLDSLANGVLRINEGRNSLHNFFEVDKTYRITALLGCETDSGDSKGSVTRFAPWSHVTEENIQRSLVGFRGSISQMPSMCAVYYPDLSGRPLTFWLLRRYPGFKVGGLTLSQYVELNKPLPESILPRRYTVSSINLLSFRQFTHHSYAYPEFKLSPDQLKERRKIFELVANSEEGQFRGRDERFGTGRGRGRRERGQYPPLRVGMADAATSWRRNEPVDPAAPSSEVSVTNEVEETLEPVQGKPPVFEIEVMVSSGVNVRTLVNDIASSIGSAAHIVALTRVAQGPFFLDYQDSTSMPLSSAQTTQTTLERGASTGWRQASGVGQGRMPCVRSKVLGDALTIWDQGGEFVRDENGWAEWERVVLENWPDQSHWMPTSNNNPKRRW